MLKETLAIILAGGKGERLYPLTRDRAKPAVPFGGTYRIIDFTLSNCLNSGLRKIVVLTQYKSISLGRHLNLGWNVLNYQLGEFVTAIPPEQRMSEFWYEGTADAVYQNIYTLDEIKPRYVLILSGDHIYTMDYRTMLDYHLERRADLTIGCVELEREDARRMGVMTLDESGRVTHFVEKPKSPNPIPGKEDKSLVSMGIYLFDTERLVQEVIRDKKDRGSRRDFGRDVLPKMMEKQDVYGYSISGYWQDVGTIDAYYRSSMDLLGRKPALDLYDENWPIRTYMEQFPAARVTKGSRGKCGHVIDSLLSPGSLVRGATVKRSILSYGVTIDEGSIMEDSIVFGDVRIGKRCQLRNCVIDKRVVIPDGSCIGFDRKKDAAMFSVTDRGIVVIPKDWNIGE